MFQWADDLDPDSTEHKQTSSSSISNIAAAQPQQQQQQVSADSLPTFQLENEWVFWYDEGTPKGQTIIDYESSIKTLGAVNTVQDFWRYWNTIVDLRRWPEYLNLRLFKQGIKPMWEDQANCDGGKWVYFSANRAETSTVTTKLALVAIGESLTFGNDICGIVLSVRPKGDTISLWNRTSSSSDIVNTTTTELHQQLAIQFKYQPHKSSMDLNKSYSSPRIVSSDSSGRLLPSPHIIPTSPKLGGSLELPKGRSRHHRRVSSQERSTPSPDVLLLDHDDLEGFKKSRKLYTEPTTTVEPTTSTAHSSEARATREQRVDASEHLDLHAAADALDLAPLRRHRSSSGGDHRHHKKSQSTSAVPPPAAEVVAGLPPYPTSSSSSSSRQSPVVVQMPLSASVPVQREPWKSHRKSASANNAAAAAHMHLTAESEAALLAALAPPNARRHRRGGSSGGESSPRDQQQPPLTKDHSLRRHVRSSSSNSSSSPPPSFGLIGGAAAVRLRVPSPSGKKLLTSELGMGMLPPPYPKRRTGSPTGLAIPSTKGHHLRRASEDDPTVMLPIGPYSTSSSSSSSTAASSTTSGSRRRGSLAVHSSSEEVSEYDDVIIREIDDESDDAWPVERERRRRAARRTGALTDDTDDGVDTAADDTEVDERPAAKPGILFQARIFNPPPAVVVSSAPSVVRPSAFTPPPSRRSTSPTETEKKNTAAVRRARPFCVEHAYFLLMLVAIVTITVATQTL